MNAIPPDPARLVVEIAAAVKASVEEAAMLIVPVPDVPDAVVVAALFKFKVAPGPTAIGSATPDRRELDEEAMRGVVVVESRASAMREAGDIVQAQAEVSAEIGELLNGAAKIHPGGSPVVFKSVGIAVEDIAAAKLVYENFVKRNVH